LKQKLVNARQRLLLVMGEYDLLAGNENATLEALPAIPELSEAE